MKSKSPSQLTDKLLMIEPTQFGFNKEAYETNPFQYEPLDEEISIIQTTALAEFNGFLSALKKLGVEVLVFRDTLDAFTPDSIFPNNWISTHENGTLYTYPMAVVNRRNERKNAVIQGLIERFSFVHADLSSWENESPPRYLEGTGGMIFDRQNRVCYAALSPRTHLSALEEFCEMANFKIVSFDAYGKNGEAIYHTNVMLSVGETFVCVGLDTINPVDRNRVMKSFEATGKEVIEFTNDQIYSHFAGNMLQVKNTNGESILVLSDRIYQELTPIQRVRLEKHNDHLLPIKIPTIERIGGGSVRCMIAELFS